MAEPSLHDVADDDIPEPPRLRVLRLAVLGTTVAMGVAVLAIAAALVIRVTRPSPPPAFDLSMIGAERILAPADETVTAAGAAPGAVILVTRDAAGAERLRFYDATTGAAGPVVMLDREE
jgi:hypothetical protein